MRKIIIMMLVSFLLINIMPTTIAESPYFSDISPSNNAKDVVIQDVSNQKYVTVSFRVDDTNGDIVFINIETNKTGTWTSIYSVTFTNGTGHQEISKKIFNCSFEKKYWWRIEAKDNTSDWTNQTFCFTTKKEENGGTGGDTSTGDIEIFPVVPTSGKTFAVIIANPIDVNGYLWIKDTMYPISITKGFGTVQTDEETYGSATIWLYGGTKKTFNINCGLSGSLSLTVPDKITVDSAVDIQVKVSGKLVGTAQVIITDPDGDTITINTTNGVVNHIFDKVGAWLIRTSLAGQNDVKEVTVDYKPMTVRADSSQYKSGDDVKVTTDNNAVVSISLDGVIKLQSIATAGVITFTPRDPGDYRVTAILGNKQGTTDFNVYQYAIIKIFDIGTNAQVISLKANNNYMVKVVDNSEQPLYNLPLIYTMQSSSTVIPSTIALSGGIGFWTPKVGGTFTLSIEQLEGYQSEPLTVTVEGTTDYVLIIAIIVIIAVVVLLLILFRSKLPQGLRELFKLKPKREVPV